MEALVKQCRACEATKPLSEFDEAKRYRLGVFSLCKTCRRSHALSRYHKFYSGNPEYRAKRALYRASRKEAESAYRRIYYEANKEQISEKRKADRQSDPEKFRARGRATARKCRDQLRGYQKSWRAENSDKVKASAQRSHNRRKQRPQCRIEAAIKSGIHRGIQRGSKTKGTRAFEILGYSVSDLMSHLEVQFLAGMSWENYGAWHIDHRIPLASFNYQSPHDADFRAAWALTNLQPLWAEDNIRKHAQRTVLL